MQNDSLATLAKTEVPDCLQPNTTNYQNLYVNGSFSCDVMFEEFLRENRLVFETYHVIRITVTAIIFVISLIGNLSVLLSVTLRRKNQEMTYTQLTITHLSLANLAFTAFILPMDAFWNFTLEWMGGDFLCRVLNMLKQCSMYISSGMIMVMGIDKVANLLFPLSSQGQRRRLKRFLAAAWVFSLLNSIPGFVLFSAFDFWPNPCECPEYQIVQCVDFTLLSRAGLRIFYFYTMSLSFFIPLICIIICYIIIAIAIRKMAKRTKGRDTQYDSLQGSSNKKNLTNLALARARRISQLVTGLITAVFVLCWGPYYVVGIIQWYEMQNRQNSNNDKIMEAIMIACSYLNPCLHPLITVYFMEDIRKNVLCTVQCPRLKLVRPITNTTAKPEKKSTMLKERNWNNKKPNLLVKSEHESTSS